MILAFILCTLVITSPLLSATVPNTRETLAPFDWAEVVVMPESYSKQQSAGNQIFHFNTSNKSVWLDECTKKYIQHYLGSAKICDSDAENLKYAVESVQIPSGIFLEFGVCTGRSINFLAALNPKITVHGFDSFQGLPEAWGQPCPKGTCALKKPHKLPPVLANVQLHVGLFSQTVPTFLSEVLKTQHIAFIHIDSDLYESARFVLDALRGNIKPGTIIVFDEYFNFKNWWTGHEFKAFQEFIATSGMKYEYLSFNQFHEQVTVKIL